MQIQKTGMATQLPNTVKITKKETDPKEQVTLGSYEPTPDFLKFVAKQTSSPKGRTILDSKIGLATATTAMFGAIGAIEAGIGWGAKTIGEVLGGPVGGLCAGLGATALIGGYTAHKCFKEGIKNGNEGASAHSEAVKDAAIMGLTSAASTWMGANHNFCTGIGLGALVSGTPAALLIGTKLLNKEVHQ